MGDRRRAAPNSKWQSANDQANLHPGEGSTSCPDIGTTSI
jgi:hypothetical protein